MVSMETDPKGSMTGQLKGRITKPEQCVFFEHRARVHFQTTGREPPASAAALLEQLAERAAIQTEQGGVP